MKLKKLGKNTLPIEINISNFGLWLIVEGTEYFLTYKDFPWFKEAKINDIYEVKLLHKYHLYWPTLDIDLDLDSLQNSEKYQLIYNK